MRTVAILHYAGPPTVGGVEATMYYHALGLADLGYSVRIVSGVGADFDDRVATVVEPLFGSKHPDILAAKKTLDGGSLPPDYEALIETLTEKLAGALAGCDVCIVHNLPTFNKNLPLTAALARYHQTHPELHLISWTHDLAWTNPQYLPELHDAPPWNLLRERWPRVDYVTVSEPRRYEVAELLNMPPEEVAVVVPGVDPVTFYHWTPTTTLLNDYLKLLDADGLLLLPARLTRRKNVALALHVLAALRRLSGVDYRLIVTGPPGPHNPTNMGYLGELLDLRKALDLEASAHFLYAYGEGEAPLIPDNDTIANMYHLADALLFPSLQEGFGIPVLEAGFAGIPVFCSDIPPFRATGQEDVYYFDPNETPPIAIAEQIRAVLESSPAQRLRARVRKTYRWESIIRERIVPLLEKGS